MKNEITNKGKTHLTMDDHYDLFISYRRGPSIEWVRSLFERLQIQHYPDGRNPSIFIDLYEIYAGRAWFPQLSAAIENCHNFLAVFTSDYFQSDICSWELERAHSLDRAGLKGFLVPLLYEEEAKQIIPFAYRGLQYLYIATPDWFSRLCKQIGLIETHLTASQDLMVRVWVEPVHLPTVRSRDITIIPKQLRGDRFRLGMDIRIGFQATADCYISIVDIGTSGVARIIYPTEQSSPNFCRKGQTYYFPANDAPFRFVLTGNLGKEQIRVFATKECLDAKSINLASLNELPISPDRDRYADASCTFEIIG